jgi:Lrp/AsnC family transcriptional regulator, regulator for asnA, asnC and gidA
MDDLDLQILAALGNNARKSYVELAHELEVSDATIHNRIRGMIDAGIIKGFVTLIDFEKIGFTVLAFVELKTKPGTADIVTPKLGKISGVIGIYEVHSHYDILLKVAAKSLKELRHKIVNEIGKIPEVLSNYNYTILNLVKDEPNPPLMDSRNARILVKA